MLRGKKILLGVCGSIAAYKAANLIRLLVKEHAEVRVIMTSSACSFITPLTLSTLSKNPAITEFVKDSSGTWNNHVELGLWADVFVVAPASANTMAKCAHGLCDNLLTATYLSARCPVIFAPAMDLDMYQHPSSIKNISVLKEYGNVVLDSEFGELASGLTGQGRMPEPEKVVEYLKKHFSVTKGALSGKKVLITAGPTFEPIDPVRFIGNRSTGKMGYAIAEACVDAGASVTLISGPTSLKLPANVDVKRVEQAREMYEIALKYFESADIIILAAAVADFRPREYYGSKMKKKEGEDILNLFLEKNPDIAREIGNRKKSHQYLVGFALETDNEIENAKAKINSKNLDLIVLNSLNDKGAGFEYDTNKITLINKNNLISSFELKSKKEAARDIVDQIISSIK